MGKPIEAVYTPALLLLVGVVGVSYLGVGFVMPLRALYSSSLGASSGEIGLMASSALLTAFIAAPGIGRLSDHFGHGNVLWLGLLAHAALILAYIPLQHPLALIGLRALEGIAIVAVLPPARALVNAIAPRTCQAEALGLLSAAQSVGILIGPVVGALLAVRVGYSRAFLLASLTLLVGAILARLLLPRQSEAHSRRAGTTPRRLLFTHPLLFVYGLQMVLSSTQGLGAAIWTIYMRDRGASLLLIGLSFTTYAVPILLLAPLAGRFADRYGRLPPLLIGFGIYVIILCLYGLPLSPLTITLLSVPEGMGAAFARGGLDGLLADATPPDIRGTIQANYSAAGTAGSFLAATAAGFLYALAPGVPFLANGLLYLAALVGLLVMLARRRAATRVRYAA
ncbi:MAG: MFS transporter [Ktedonobacterales bacterium]|nr:MFS transporter [Ktedonobacterales bacterium]